MSSEHDTTGPGPYASVATCAPSDLDPIASGIIPAMSTHKLSREVPRHGNREGDENVVNGSAAEHTD